MPNEATTQTAPAAPPPATEIEVPVYETFSSNHHILIHNKEESTKDEKIARQPLVFRGAHRGFGAIRLDHATLFSTFPDVIGDDTAEDSPGVVNARALAVKIIESTPEFKRGLGEAGKSLLGRPGVIWKQSDLAEVRASGIMTSMRSLVAQYDKSLCLKEAKRRQLSVRQPKENEPAAEYLKFLQDLVFADMSGGAVAAPAGTSVTQVAQGVGTRRAA